MKKMKKKKTIGLNENNWGTVILFFFVLFFVFTPPFFLRLVMLVIWVYFNSLKMILGGK